MQWKRLTDSPKFASVANSVRATNEGRHIEQEAIHRDMAAVTMRYPVDEILADLRAATIPATRIFDVRQVRELPQLRDKLTRTVTPNGKTIHMQPLAVDVPERRASCTFRPNTGPIRAAFSPKPALPAATSMPSPRRGSLPERLTQRWAASAPSGQVDRQALYIFRRSRSAARPPAERQPPGMP